jgi:monoamine oxidase
MAVAVRVDLWAFDPKACEKMRSIFARLHRRYGKKISGAERQRFVRKNVDLHPVEAPAAPRAERLAMRGKPKPRVAIVGAGFAGLMAGYSLADRCQVAIFEARERIGGRVWSKSRAGGIVEAGGELIGYNHPLWLQLAKKFELGLSVITSDTNFDALDLDMPLYLDGEKISERRMERVYDEMLEAFDRMTRRATKVDPHKPWQAANARKLDLMPVSDWISGLRCSPLAKLAIEEQLSNDAGQPTEKQSYLANLAVVAGGALDGQPGAFFTQTETLRCSEGNQALAGCLANAIEKKGGTIHLSAPVRAIHIDDDRVTVEAEGKTPEIADYVILAIPPSLWPGAKFGKISIDPQLPADYYVSMGKAVKYLSPLKNRFWIGEGLAPTATSNRFGVTWEGTDNQIAAPGRDVELTLFAGGAAAQSALNKWAAGGKSAVDAFYASQLGKVYKGYAASLSKQPDFIAWPADPWTGAGYSCPAPGEVCRAGPLLRKGFRKRMFFAGEHTCFAYFGYMEGALQSGQIAASAVLKTASRQRQRQNA